METSSFLPALADILHRKEAADPDFIRVVHDLQGEEADEERVPCDVLEGGPLTRPVEVDGRTSIRYFCDGKQSSQLLGYQGGVPILYGWTAACIRERGEDRRLRLWDVRTREALYMPTDQVEAGEYEALGIPIQDTHHRVERATRSGYRNAASYLVQLEREAQEKELVRLWGERGGDGWLALDGRVDAKVPHVIGVVKSHATPYLEAAKQDEVFRMGAGERSAAFAIETGGTRVYSWYLRIHSLPRHDPRVGLIRVEVAQGGDDDLTALADRVSSWLLAERAPTSHPDPRWANMPYGVYDCEQFLESIQPPFIYLTA